MQVAVETIEGLGRRMTITLPADQIEQEISKRLQSLSRTVRLKGFRPGKVPLKVIRQQYGSRVLAEALDEMTRSSFFEAVSQEGLKLAGYPVFDHNTPEMGKDYQYTATFDIAADFELAALDDLKLERATAEIADADVDGILEKLRRQSCSWESVDRAAEDGDRLTVDFTGLLEGEPFDKGTAEGLQIVLGSGNLIPGFEDGLLAAKSGEERMLDLTFPEDYHDHELAGKAVQFAVKVKQVEAAVLPDIDEDFARTYEIEDGSIETLRSEVRQSMQTELGEAIRLNLRRQVMDALFERHPMDLPHLQVEAQYKDYLSRHQGEASEEQQQRYREAAQRQVALGAVVGRIVKEQGLRPDATKVRARVESIAAGYDDQEAVLAWYYGDRQRLAEVEALVLEDAVVEWVIEQAEVTDKPSAFSDLVAG